jgi:ubiquinone/menaquinone biosynthesis C-methylase UbiE
MSRDSNPGRPSNRPRRPAREGWEGWDQYAPFYDWENARTLGRRDVKFWTHLARRTRGRVLELGCGTGRVSWPLVKAGVDLVGIDRSEAMLARASKTTPPVVRVRGDIRALPFADRSFAMAIAPYGVLQSLTRPHDLADALRSVTRVVCPGGMLAIDLVPDVPNWREYENKIQMRGRSGGTHLTLVESVRQDRQRRVTIFEQCYVERRGRKTREHRFELTFRTLSVPTMRRELAHAGFSVTAVLGDYDGRPLSARWNARAARSWGAWRDRNACLILARKGRKG